MEDEQAGEDPAITAIHEMRSALRILIVGMQAALERSDELLACLAERGVEGR